MKKLLSLLLALCMIFSLAACGSNSGNNNSNAASSDEEAEYSDETEEVSTEKPGTFQKDASLAETVMVDENGVKITATGLNYTDDSADLALTIENNSGKDLSIVSGSMGYSCNSVNGYMVSDSYLNCDVADGKKANDVISFNCEGLMLYGINEIADIEIGFDISDADGNHRYSGPRQVKTSAFDAHDYNRDYYQETIASRAAMNTYEYDMTHFSKDTLYDVKGIKLLSSGMMVNRDGNTALLLELENTTDDLVYVSASDIAINGLVVSSGIWSSDAINPGKRGIVDIDVSSALNAEYWSVYGIKEIGSVSLALRQSGPDGKEISDKTSVEIVLPDVKAEYDAAGTEVYSKDGLRIVAKTVLEDPDDYSNDMNVLLLAENKSGKTLTIGEVYDSLSVNGFMTDCICESREIKDGESAVLEISLMESSLKDNKIASASDIKKVEMGFEIKEGRNTLDEPTIKISFE